MYLNKGETLCKQESVYLGSTELFEIELFLYLTVNSY